MLAFAALLGIVLTGVVADAAMGMASARDDSDEDEGSAVPTEKNAGASGELSNWPEDDDLARIEDFDSSTDQIVVVYDPARHPEPVLTVQPSDDGMGSLVMLDGLPVAELPGVDDLTAEMIRLSPDAAIAA